MKHLFALISLCFALAGHAQTSNTAIVHEPNFGFTLTAPKGWKYDLKAGQDVRLPVVFYPDTSSWLKAPAVMYANISFLSDTSDQRNVDDVIRHDIERFEKRAFGEKTEVVKLKTLRTFTQRREAIIYNFTMKADNSHEAVAYIEEKNTVIMIVLGTRDPELYKQLLPAFEQLVLSYYGLKD